MKRNYKIVELPNSDDHYVLRYILYVGKIGLIIKSLILEIIERKGCFSLINLRGYVLI